MNLHHSILLSHRFTFSLSLAVFFACSSAPASTFFDDFSGGLQPGYWTIMESIPGFYSLDASHENVQLAKTSAHNTGGVQYIFIRLNLARFGGPIAGDFSTQVSFTNAAVPGPGLDQVELHTYYQDSSIFFAVYDNSSGLNAHVWDGGSVRGVNAATQNSGTFRITRSGSTVSGYFNDTLLYSLERFSPLADVDFVLQNNNSSDDAISVTFDDFSTTADSIRPPLHFAAVSGGQLEFSWSTNIAGFHLEECTSLTGSSWKPVTNPAPIISQSRYIQRVSMTEKQQFFRLNQP